MSDLSARFPAAVGKAYDKAVENLFWVACENIVGGEKMVLSVERFLRGMKIIEDVYRELQTLKVETTPA